MFKGAFFLNQFLSKNGKRSNSSSSVLIRHNLIVEVEVELARTAGGSGPMEAIGVTKVDSVVVGPRGQVGVSVLG